MCKFNKILTKYPTFHEIQQTDSKCDMKMQRTEASQDSHREKQNGRNSLLDRPLFVTRMNKQARNKKAQKQTRACGYLICDQGRDDDLQGGVGRAPAMLEMLYLLLTWTVAM